MANPFDDDNGEFIVLVNYENQHSLWPTFREIPAGWKAVGPRGSRKECINWIDENWTDLRPKTLIDFMESSNEP
jgi:MbtH protein